MDKIDINSADAQSEDVVGENIRRLGDLFPELLTEGPAGPSVNIDVLKQLVGDSSVSDIDEKYGLSWFGKRDARKMALTPSLGTLLPRPEESEDWDNTKNLMIEGDNLEVLKLLQKSYSGKVKLIYIDPPYNTGKDFVYRDNFQDSIKHYLERTGQTEDGKKTTSNIEVSGRRHTDWLNMMYPRLKLAKNLLEDDGLMFISIDDREVKNLTDICDELFGEENRLGPLVWYYEGVSDNQAFVKKTHEYVLLYQKTNKVNLSTKLHDNNVILNEVIENSVVKNGAKNPPSTVTLPIGFPCDLDSGIVRKSDVIAVSASDDFEIQNGTLIKPVEVTSGWSSRDILLRFIESGFQPILDSKGQETVFSITRAGNIVYRKVRAQSHIMSVLRNLGTTANAGSALKESGIDFDFPKPVGLLQYLISFQASLDGIVLDFFAGSGTTGQAVMEQNILDGGARRFILVQLPELIADPPVLEKGFENIAQITAERLRSAGSKLRSENPLFVGDVGFRVFKLAESNIRAWNPFAEDLEGTLRLSEDHLVEGRSALDVLYEILLKRGLDLCIPIETKEIAGHHVNAVGGGVLFACLDSQIAQTDVETLAEGIVAWRKELSVVGDVNCIFRDSAFDNDVAKSNMSSILEQAGFTKIQSL